MSKHIKYVQYTCDLEALEQVKAALQDGYAKAVILFADGGHEVHTDARDVDNQLVDELENLARTHRYNADYFRELARLTKLDPNADHTAAASEYAAKAPYLA